MNALYNIPRCRRAPDRRVVGPDAVDALAWVARQNALEPDRIARTIHGRFAIPMGDRVTQLARRTDRPGA